MSNLILQGQRILSGRRFRLLLIYPSSDHRQQIECHCFPFDLDTAPAYEALSYAWGEQTPTTEIRLNGSPIALGPSLAGALLRLRLSLSTRILWIDALCINQNDDEEKSHQVPLMGSIYSSARRVVVWLGDQDMRSSVAAKVTVHCIGGACRQYDLARGQTTKDVEGYDELDMPAELFQPHVLQALKQLFGRQWFTRIWCVQEICLAQAAVVMYGDLEMPWEAVGLTASWIFAKTTRPGDRDALSLSLDSILSDNADTMYDGNLRGSLLEVLQYFREFNATDPRDRVYGLLNLVTEKREIEALKVDYGKSRAQVYADTTLVVIRLYSRLTTLSWVLHPEDYDEKADTRSWAPIWDDANSTSVLGYPERAYPWSACGARLTSVLDESYVGYDQLRLSGVYYATVIDVHDTMTPYNLEIRLKRGRQHLFTTTCRAFEGLDLILEASS